MVTLRSNLKAPLTGILFLAAVGVASPVPTPAQQSSAVKFRTLNPPNGDFVIAVPSGWGFEENKFENPITVAPAGGVGPSATIWAMIDRKSTRLNSSHSQISYAVFCLKNTTSRQPLPHEH